VLIIHEAFLSANCYPVRCEVNCSNKQDCGSALLYTFRDRHRPTTTTRDSLIEGENVRRDRKYETSAIVCTSGSVRGLRLADCTIITTYCTFSGHTRTLHFLSPIHAADADATKLFCRVESASAVCTFATSSRRLPTDSIDNLETGQTVYVCFCVCLTT